MGTGKSVRRTAVAACGAWLVVAGCGGKSGPTSPSSYIVTYALTGSVDVAFDSAKYDNGLGVMTRVTAPDSGWLASVSVAAGGSVEAWVWGVASAGSQWAQIKVTWTAAGSARRDSSRAVISAPGLVTLQLPRRTI